MYGIVRITNPRSARMSVQYAPMADPLGNRIRKGE